MNNLKRESAFDTSINRETFNNILEENELFVQQYNNEINVVKMNIQRKN